MNIFYVYIQMDQSEQSLETPKNNNTKKRRPPCPRGSRRNKAGDCVKYVKPGTGVERNKVLEPDANTTPLPENILEPDPDTNKLVVEENEIVQEPPKITIQRPKNPKKVILDDILAAVPTDSNEYLRKKEKIEFDQHLTQPAISDSMDMSFLYPDLDDPLFSTKIAKRKEFYDTQYDGAILPIKEQAEKMCNAEVELFPQQIFVKNFLSLQTPYNSLLLYHGLGSGKTCSAIGIAEEMRAYMKQIGIKRGIIIVASPNVQANFRLQLFDERRLKLAPDGSWTIDSCIGDSLIREVNPTNLKGIPKEKIISQIKSLINQYYVFTGYIELANYIHRETSVPEAGGYSAEQRKTAEMKNVQRTFNNRLIIIDEVHNIRLTDENKNARTAKYLLKLAKYCDNLRFLMLSATPMYNSHKEIVWLVNLMNMNDKRGTVTTSEIFESDGQFRKPVMDPSSGLVVQEGGMELLHRKMIGYISYVRGENPYTFPYRIYPDDFSPENTFNMSSATPIQFTGQNIRKGINSVLDTVTDTMQNLGEIFSPESSTMEGSEPVQKIPNMESPPSTTNRLVEPTVQLNNKPIDEPLQNLPLYVTQAGEYQEKAYQLVINKMRQEPGALAFEDLDRFGFRRLQAPLEALNMVYPSTQLDENIAAGELNVLQVEEEIVEIIEEEDEEEHRGTGHLSSMVGKRGMRKTMNFIDDSRKPVPMIYGFEYKPEILERYGRIFSPEKISMYSSKIARICDIIRRSKGIVMIYSQYIEGGIIPLSLALEEMGFGRYGSADYTKSLFANPPTEPLNATTMKPRSQMSPGSTFHQAKYMLITGTKAFSPQNAADVKYATSQENRNGEMVKVILISKAGSEGLDFKNIRQVHILEPWYNLNRIEQIIGRAVRNLSHCNLPFEERNVEIYMHSTTLMETPEQEAADVYVYRLAKKKAEQIGRVTRLIKETAVDCLLNIGQTNFTVNRLNQLAQNQRIEIRLSTDEKRMRFQIGDRPYTDICDYMGDCSFQCRPENSAQNVDERDLVQDTYSEKYAQVNNPRIIKRIRELFREHHFYNKVELVNRVNVVKQYPIEHIFSALTALIKNKNEFLVDKYGRRGNLVNRGKIYAFQPVEINDEGITVFERSVPIDVKRSFVDMEIPKEFPVNASISGLLSAAVGSVPDTNVQEIEKKTDTDTRYSEILDIFRTNLKHATTKNSVIMGDLDWYRHASTVIDVLQLNHGIGFEQLVDHLIRHMVDLLLPSEKLVLIAGMYQKIRAPEKMDELEKVIKDYLDSKMVSSPDRSVSGIIMADVKSWKVYVKSGENEWIEADSEDIRDLELSGLKINYAKYASLVGFINMYKTGNDMVFRIKDMTQTQNSTGVRVDTNQNKVDIIRRINSILGKQLYTTENTKTISQKGFCVILEMMLRQYTDDLVGGKIWFLDPEQAAYNNIVKLTAATGRK